MGSKLRKLRAKAGVTGESYQREQRRHARNREVLKRIANASPAAVTVSFDSSGGQLRSSEQLREKLTPAAALAGALPGSSDLAFHRIRLEEQRIQLAQLLGSHDGAEELADAITLAARSSVDSHNEVWERALSELRRGVPAAELSMLRKPEPPKQEWHIHRPGQRSRLFSLLALAMVGGLAVPPRRDR